MKRICTCRICGAAFSTSRPPLRSKTCSAPCARQWRVQWARAYRNKHLKRARKRARAYYRRNRERIIRTNAMRQKRERELIRAVRALCTPAAAAKA